MHSTRLMLMIFALATLALAFTASAENIDPDKDGSQYAYGQSIGWLNFEPNIPGANVGATVTDHNVTGFVWAENIGWINLDPNDADPNTGVSNDGTGLLSGYAWGENVGWINFCPNVPGDSNHYGVTIDHQSNFAGWAWGENIGWIHFRATFTVDWDDLTNFSNGWLNSGTGLLGDLNGNNKVDFIDYGIFASYWLADCPVDWPLGPRAYKVKTAWLTSCAVDIDDLGRFCNLWLETGPGLKADLDSSDDVDFKDYSTVAALWLELCPVGWPLKD